MENMGHVKVHQGNIKLWLIVLISIVVSGYSVYQCFRFGFISIDSFTGILFSLVVIFTLKFIEKTNAKKNHI